MRIALTADLHWGQNPVGDDATLALVEALRISPPDALILAGDQGTEDHFAECLRLFDELKCPKALVPGNHDIWVDDKDCRGDSLEVYERLLPEMCRQHGFHYLDHGPLILSPSLALVGSINWYDYSWSIARIQAEYPGNEWRLESKEFTRGRHNDARFIRWPHSDQDFTSRVVGAMSGHLKEALGRADKALAITHHPPVYGLGFPRDRPPESLDGLLWDALCGNAAMERLLMENTAKIPFVFCGHTHRDREHRFEATRGYNIGGDYHFKRLLVLDWPSGDLESRTFGDPAQRAI